MGPRHHHRGRLDVQDRYGALRAAAGGPRRTRPGGAGRLLAAVFAAAGKEGVLVGHLLGHCSACRAGPRSSPSRISTTGRRRRPCWPARSRGGPWRGVSLSRRDGWATSSARWCGGSPGVRSAGFLTEEITGRWGRFPYWLGPGARPSARRVPSLRHPRRSATAGQGQHVRLHRRQSAHPADRRSDQRVAGCADDPGFNGVSNARSVALMQVLLACEGEVLGGRRLMSAQGLRCGAPASVQRPGPGVPGSRSSGAPALRAQLYGTTRVSVLSCFGVALAPRWSWSTSCAG